MNDCLYVCPSCGNFFYGQYWLEEKHSVQCENCKEKNKIQPIMSLQILGKEV
jgi:DNA-directed RNA polymerase subunit RPC12/RpoP